MADIEKYSPGNQDCTTHSADNPCFCRQFFLFADMAYSRCYPRLLLWRKYTFCPVCFSCLDRWPVKDAFCMRRIHVHSRAIPSAAYSMEDALRLSGSLWHRDLLICRTRLGCILVLRQEQFVPIRIDDSRVCLVIENCLQFLSHLCRAGISLFRIERAGFQNNLAKAPFPINRQRDFLAAHAFCQRQFAAAKCNRFWCRRQKRHPVLVQQPIQNDSERVKIHTESILPAPVDLRRHVIICTFFREAGHCFLNGPGDAEVAQFEIPVVGYEDIFRLNIPVDDIILLA